MLNKEPLQPKGINPKEFNKKHRLTYFFILTFLKLSCLLWCFSCSGLPSIVSFKLFKQIPFVYSYLFISWKSICTVFSSNTLKSISSNFERIVYLKKYNFLSKAPKSYQVSDKNFILKFDIIDVSFFVVINTNKI